MVEDSTADLPVVWLVNLLGQSKPRNTPPAELRRELGRELHDDAYGVYELHVVHHAVTEKI